MAGSFELATVQESQLNRAEPREVKDNSQNFLKTNGKSAKYNYPPHKPREPFSRSTRANIGELHYTKRGTLTREGLTNLV